jgi:hypothetical protein
MDTAGSGESGRIQHYDLQDLLLCKVFQNNSLSVSSNAMSTGVPSITDTQLSVAGDNFVRVTRNRLPHGSALTSTL